MTPAFILGILAVLILPPLVALVRDREAQLEAEEVRDDRVAKWRAE